MKKFSINSVLDILMLIDTKERRNGAISEVAKRMSQIA